MAKVKKSSGKSRKKKLEKIGKRLEEIDLELSRIERDLAKGRAEGAGLVDEDMRKRERTLDARQKQVEDFSDRPVEDYRGVKIFYRKFVSRLKSSLK